MHVCKACASECLLPLLRMPLHDLPRLFSQAVPVALRLQGGLPVDQPAVPGVQDRPTTFASIFGGTEVRITQTALA
jgi:hypothetical protein